MKDIKKFDVLRIENESSKWIEDAVSIERNIIIYINDEEFVTLMCTPVMVKELSVGFLLFEGIISKINDIKEIDYNEIDGIVSLGIKGYSRKVIEEISPITLTSGCGKGLATDFLKGFTKEHKVASSLRVSSKDIMKILKDFINMSTTYRQTGCVHSAALWNGKEIEIFCDDIGRHNAVDKVFGYSLLNNISLKDKIILTSGRITSEILIKVSRRGVPMIISRNAPTSLAIEMAYFLGITIVGFVRGQRINIYTYPERVVFDS